MPLTLRIFLKKKHFKSRFLRTQKELRVHHFLDRNSLLINTFAWETIFANLTWIFYILVSISHPRNNVVENPTQINGYVMCFVYVFVVSMIINGCIILQVWGDYVCRNCVQVENQINVFQNLGCFCANLRRPSLRAAPRMLLQAYKWVYLTISITYFLQKCICVFSKFRHLLSRYTSFPPRLPCVFSIIHISKN